MSKTVRAKFRVQSITRMAGTRYDLEEKKYVPQEQQVIRLQPVYDDGNPENKAFYAATPSGSIELGVVTAEAGSHFELEQSYYVDFTKAE